MCYKISELLKEGIGEFKFSVKVYILVKYEILFLVYKKCYFV